MNAQYFIDKFSAIPDDQWRCDGYYGTDGNPRCALGHCGLYDGGSRLGHCGMFGNAGTTDEERALRRLFNCLCVSPARINDNTSNHFPQSTPKARILAALEYIKTL